MATEFVLKLARAIGANSAALASVLPEIRRLLQHDEVAKATLVMFEQHPHTEFLQQQLSQALAAKLDAVTLARLAAELEGTAQPGGVTSTIEAGEDALIQGSGHKIVAPDVPVNASTRAGKGGRIIDSGITIIGSTAPPQQSSSPSAAPHSSRGRLPATLSADGTHFSYGHALLIGVGEYQRKSLTAPNTANDAARLRELLEDPLLAGYNDSQVTLLQNSAATRAGILAAFDALAERLRRVQTPQRPTVVVFFAGHGIQNGDGYYLLSHDYDGENLAGTALSSTVVREKVQTLAALSQKLVVLLNCCHAGGAGGAVLSDESEEQTDAPSRDFISSLAEGSGQVVISSSRPEQKSSAESDDDRSLTTFGSMVLRGFRGEAPGVGPAIGIFDLFAHLATTVPADAAGVTYRGAPLVQQPLLFARSVDQNFPIALRPAGSRNGTLSAEHPNLVQRLAELEIQLFAYASEQDAPELVQERDDVLRALGAG